MTDARAEVKRMAEESADRAFEKHVKGRLGGTDRDARDEPLLRALAEVDVGDPLTDAAWRALVKNGSQTVRIAARYLAALRPLIEVREREAYERGKSEALQSRVQPWVLACFGEDIANDRSERNHRFLEEALELVQSCGCPRADAHALVDYVYDREAGEPDQEVGGVMITLAALCLANGLDMHDAGERELSRIWKKIDRIRQKQAAKPRNSPLPDLPQKEAETAAHNAAIEKAAEVARQAERDYRAAVRHYQKEGGNFTLASEMYARAEEAKSLLDAIRALKR